MLNVKSFSLMVSLAATLYLFQSCDGSGSGRAPNLSAHVPSNSTFVMMINVSLLTKMDYEAFKKTTYFQDRLAEIDSSVLMQQLMDDPRSMGLDMDGEMALSVVFNEDVNDADAYIMAGISDLEK